jgi:hypothetical protein
MEKKMKFGLNSHCLSFHPVGARGFASLENQADSKTWQTTYSTNNCEALWWLRHTQGSPNPLDNSFRLIATCIYGKLNDKKWWGWYSNVC